MDQGKNQIKEKMVVAAAWLFVLALVYLVYLKFKLASH